MKKIKKSFFRMLAMASVSALLFTSASALLFTSSTLRLSTASDSSRKFSAIWPAESQTLSLYADQGDAYSNPLDDSDDDC